MSGQRLQQLALRFEQALDGLPDGVMCSSASDAAGQALYEALSAAPSESADKEHQWQAQEPIILKTHLAASFTAYFQRISKLLTPEALIETEGTLAAARRSMCMLYHSMLYHSVMLRADLNSEDEHVHQLAAHLLQQVWPRFHMVRTL